MPAPNYPNAVQQVPAPTSANDTAAPASNVAAVCGYGPAPGWSHVVTGICWSYSGGTLSGGNLIVQDGTTTIFQIDVTTEGPGFIPFNPPKINTPGNSLTATLAAGGSSVAGKVSFLGHWMQPAPPHGQYPSYDFSVPLNSFYL
jgi:hypothetical protein